MKIKKSSILNINPVQSKHLGIAGYDLISASKSGILLETYQKEHEQRIYKDAIAAVLNKAAADVTREDVVRVYRANLPFVREKENGKSYMSFTNEALKTPYAVLSFHSSMNYNLNVSEVMYNDKEETDYFTISSSAMTRATYKVGILIATGVPRALKQGDATKAQYAYQVDPSDPTKFIDTPLADVQKSIYALDYGFKEGYVVADNEFKVGHLPKKGEKATLLFDLFRNEWVAVADATALAPTDGQGVLECTDYNASTDNIKKVGNVETFIEPFPSLWFEIKNRVGDL